MDRRKIDKRVVSDGLVYIGHSQISRHSKEKVVQGVYEVAVDIPELLEYKLPSQTPADEYFVLATLASKLREETELGEKCLEAANDLMEGLTAPSFRPAWFADGRVQLDDVLQVIQNQNRAKAPGYPASLLAGTKGHVIDRHIGDLAVAIFARMVCLEILGPYCKTAMDFYECFCMDPISFSIKTEVIKKTKSGRGLAAISIVDSCVERLLYAEFNIAFKGTCYESYSAIGIGFTKEDSDLLHAACSPRPGFSSDAPTFDWSVTYKENELNVQLTMKCQGCPVDSRAYRIAIQHERTLSLATFIIGNGWMYAQVIPGATKTGRDQTSVFNTMVRARRSYAVDILLNAVDKDMPPSRPTCAGDDCDETPHAAKEDAYNLLGFPLRDSCESEDLKFCSHSWPKGKRPIGERIHKCAFKLLMGPSTDERVLAFVQEFCGHKEFARVFRAILAHRPEMKLSTDKMFPTKTKEDDRRGATVDLLKRALSVDDDDQAPEYVAFAKDKKPKAKVHHTSGQKTETRGKPRRIRGRGDFVVDPTPEGISSSLHRIETRLENADKPSVSKAASSIGRALGSFVPLPGAADLGAAAGDWLAKAFGHGDYDVKTNSLIKHMNDSMAGAEVPSFGTDKRGIRIREREFLGNVMTGSGTPSAFTNSAYPIQPANPATFPWLSTVAQLFDQWEPHGIIFEFKTTSSDYSTNMSLGSVIMSTDYNCNDPYFTTKLQMENAAYCCSTKPSNDLMHGVECDVGERPTKLLYTRVGAVPDSLNQYDLGNFQIATASSPVASAQIGELWISYDITFYKKSIQAGLGFNLQSAEWLQNTAANVTYTDMFGYQTATKIGGLAAVLNLDTLTFPNYVTTGRYLIITELQGAGASTTAITVTPTTNCVSAPSATSKAVAMNEVQQSGAATGATVWFCYAVIDITGPSAVVTFACGNNGTPSKSFLSVIQVSSQW